MLSPKILTAKLHYVPELSFPETKRSCPSGNRSLFSKAQLHYICSANVIWNF